MSLPDGFLDDLRDRLSIADVVARKVTWDRKKSQPGKGDWWAPCPFHEERTASFHVDDRKGFYYCFGCHAKGDAIAFVRETENVGFMEAVERLASQAGLEVPARDPDQQKKIDHRSALIDVVEQAVRFFATQLRSQAGAAAREYLARRGLDAAACARWEVGLAPAGWRGLADALGGRGTDAQALRDAGLTKVSEKGGAPYDVFRDRIMFPIRDGRGRAIGFGGRAMAENGPKYLNSPETVLFDKSRSLYNLHQARGQKGELILAEGYMDVIALGEAGFRAVAPLGTAVTAEQLALLWRAAPEPVVMLDGDTAGTRAAERLIELALPLLGPERSLRFARLPEGQDPDDLLRAEGAGAVRALLGRSEPLVDLLWQRETAGRDLDSPERRAALDARLRAAIGRIEDPGLRRHYGDEIAARRRTLFRPAAPPWKGRRSQPPAAPRAGTRASALARGDAGAALRIKAILAALVAHPDLVARFEGPLMRLSPDDPDHARLLDALLSGHRGAALAAAIGPDRLASLTGDAHVRITPAARAEDAETAAQAIVEALDRAVAEQGASEEIADAIAGVDQEDEGMTWRLGEIARARSASGSGTASDDRSYDRAPNGVLLDRRERAASKGVFDAIDFARGGKRGAGSENDG